ncbi:MAG: hypothetical protein KDA28_07530, partial [Phycisphaerales bacterium]|nr:hypothetical protein [Phycisphaerales bacterium]
MLIATMAASLTLAADPHRFVLQFQSDFDAASTIAVEASGTVIGDYDPDTNPGGTQTRPGTSGGEGNQPIGNTVSVGGDDSESAIPEGDLWIDVDLGASTMTLTRLDINLLREDVLTIPMDSTRTFDVFHTVSPDSVFPPGYSINGSYDDVLVHAMTATLAPSGGTLTMTPQLDNTWSLDGTLDLVITTEATSGGAPFEVEVVTATATASGSVVFAFPDETAELILVVLVSVDQAIDGTAFGLESEALDVPTVLPPGQVAHLLSSMTVGQASHAADLSLTIFADGTSCLGDFNVDGVGDIFDVIDFLGAFNEGAPEADW